MKSNQLLLVITTAFAFLLLPEYTASSYFQPCEYIECYLYPEASSIIKFENSTVMDVMQRIGFNMMTNLLIKTGVANNLTAPGPFTVFALTDVGFNELKSKAPAWYNYFTANPIPVLLDFIVNGLLEPPNIHPGTSVMSQGGKIYFDSNDNGKTMVVNGSRIIDYLPASNGIVYAVTNQIVEDIFSMLPYLPTTAGEELSIMIQLLKISGVSKMIDHPGSLYTLFVPTDKALKSLPSGTLQALMEDLQKLEHILLNHLLPNALFINYDEIPVSGSLQTVGGAFIPFQKTADGQMKVGVNGAKIILPNRPGNNGVNHVIDQIIMVDGQTLL